MKIVHLLIVSLMLNLGTAGMLVAEDATSAMKRLGAEVAALKIGFGDYVLGSKLTDKQRDIAGKSMVEKTIKGSYKFYDKGAYIIADSKTDMVIGLYKENTRATPEDLKNLVGELMMQFEEPTTMAHEKLIYWAFGKEGRISQEAFEESRQTGGKDVLATVKFSSSLPVRPTPPKDEKGEKEGKNGEKKEKVADELSSVYVMITSNPLSKIFLAANK